MTEAARGHLAMLAFSALVAGSFSLGGMAAPFIDPAALNAVRFTLAAAAMWAIAMTTTGVPRSMFASPWRYLIVAALFAAYFVTMFEGLKTARPVSMSAVFTLNPALSAVFGYLLLAQVTTLWMAAAIVIGGAGALWVIFDGSPQALVAFDIGRGEAIFFWGVVGHALYAPLLRRLSRGEPAAAQTAVILTFGAVLLALWSGPRLLATEWADLPAIVWWTIGYTAIAATAVSFSLVRYATFRLPSTKVMAYTYLTPSWVILWEIAVGQGTPPEMVLPGVALTAFALLMLLREETA
ncbi:EamA-like transporter family protein [Citreimonas salinaria]|uniref:EamA-like transporter family protein n=1 Tax=Citreimonas salinaria TaxID=321339 RepID=A0A1H3FFF9_9RHOB|nr:DMT family transporter [Citreimonas salinaria]SDX89696.1 EamA-like transporter family protein [Citreimonas salinaria]